MLKKLLKYDFLASSKIFIMLYSIVAFLSILAKIVITVAPEGFMSSPIIIFLVPTYFLLMIGLVVAGEIFLVVRFYKSYFTDEGYLSHTLPVKSWQLILSKLITSVVLTAFGFIVVILCGILLLAGDPLQTIISEFPAMQAAFEMLLGCPLPLAIALVTLLAIISAFSSYLLYFASITLGQVLIPKHKILGAFAAYMIFYVAIQIITSIPTFAFTFSQVDVILTEVDELSFVANLYQFTYFLSLALSLLSCGVFFWLSNFIMKKKLNLE